MKKQTILILAITLLSIYFTACGGTGAANSSKPPAEQPMPVGALMNEYEKSKDATVAKYNGKNLTVVGYTTTEPIMPKDATDTGILIIMERGGDMLKTLTCNFNAADKADFEGVKADQRVVINGTFADDISTALKSCKRIKTE